jgi:(1->4)-alpha-D-glucan 1-alpha-D-glucosylmutase
LKPDLAYEEAFLRFVEQILDPAEGNRFPGELAACAEKIAFYGMINSLSQTLLKIVVPGVPDFYQGTELWDLSFVDPDNRRAVDYERRRRILGELSSCAPEHRLTLAEELLSNWQDGRIKLFLTHEALNFRRHYQDVFLGGEYIPLRVCGDLEECVCAFARRQGSEWVVTAVPRLVAEIAPSANAGSFAQVWGSSAIALPDAAPRLWRNVLTGESLTASDFGDEPKTLRLNDLFAHFPVGLVYSGGATAATRRAAPSPRQEDQRDRV